VTGFAIRVDDDIDLVLADRHVVDDFHRTILANLEHLQPWEELARASLTLDEVAQAVRQGCAAWVEGTAVPTAIRHQGKIVGALSARIAPALGRAELGYWIDAAHQGRGIVTRAVRALEALLFDAENIERIELRMAAENHRSRAVADRLGYVLEGTLRRALPLQGRRHDVVVYGKLRTER
jgi:ribosomal-protein-serine acetyltransferase